MTTSANSLSAQDGIAHAEPEIDTHRILKPTERMLLEKTLLQLYPRLQKQGLIPWKWFSPPLIPEAILQFAAPGLRRIVEIGCGDGLLSNTLSLLFPDVEIIGIDSNREAIAYARQTIGYRQNLKFVCANAQVLAEIPCDRIIYSHCLSHQASLYAFKKLVMKTSGWVVDEGDIWVREAPWQLLHNWPVVKELYPAWQAQRDVAGCIRSVLAEWGYPQLATAYTPGLAGFPTEVFYRISSHSTAHGGNSGSAGNLAFEWQDWGAQSNDSLVGFLFSNNQADFSRELQ